MAHQTFYIDIDEEITSIVERLRHARAPEIILVVPKRALLIQSIVNLRILKREADEARLQLMMVTQDKLGKILIEKAGIFVQQKMDNIADEEIELKEEEQPAAEYEMEKENIEKASGRLEKIGSESYFNAVRSDDLKKVEAAKLQAERLTVKKPEVEKEKLINKELVRGAEKNYEKKPAVKQSFDLQSAKSNVDNVMMKLPAPKPAVAVSPAAKFISQKQPSDSFDMADKKITDFFQQPNAIDRQIKKMPVEKKEYEPHNLPGKVHRWFWAFGAVAILAAVGVLAYLFIPKADVVISAKLDTQTINSQITAKVGALANDNANGVIPAKALSDNQEVSESYGASGSETVSNQKAHGVITIYNDYSSSPQPLVATTRFVTADGKLFRLVNEVTVPGVAMVNGQPQSGTVDAQVMADESGDSANIGPATFSIPGFKSSGDKYNKIYAKSTVAMTGGGNGAGEVKVITDSDIASAKSKILTKLNNKLESDMKLAGGDNTIILDGALSEGDVSYKISNSAGDVADSFQITASASAQVVAVNQKDLDEIIANMLDKKATDKKIDPASIKVVYSRADADFAAGTLGIKFQATGDIVPDFTSESIKKAILGKNESQIKAYLSTFPNIQKMEVSYWPSFISGRLPFQANRVKVTIDSV